MNKGIMLLVVCGSLIFGIESAWGQQQVTVRPTLKAATVYLQQAELQFEGVASIPNGSSEVVFTDLPRNVNPSSVQVSAGSDITLLSASFSLNFLKSPEDHPAVRKLRDSVELMTQQVRQLQGQKEVVKGLMELLQSNREVGGENTGVQLEQLSRVYDYYNQRMSELHRQRLDLEEKEKKASERLLRLQQQLGELNQRLQQPSGQVVVAVASPSTRSVRFTLILVANDAGWTPVYDMRVKDVTSPVQVSYKASVYQNTGIDWNDVRLKLSTGNPAAGAAGPTLYPWYLDFYQPVSLQEVQIVQGKNRAEIQSAPTLMEDAYSKTAADFTQVRQMQLAVEFDISLPYTILSGSKPQLVSVQDHQLPATYRYYCIPKLDDDVFLKAAISGWENLNFLPGMANVFFEGAFVGQTHINPAETGDTLSVSLGRDRSIIVKRETVKEFTRTTTFGDQVRKSMRYRLSARNNRKEAITLELIDQIPVSRQSKIEVSPDESGGAQLNKETGQLTWLLGIRPAEEQQVQFGFTVKYPKGKPPAGL
ncbi:MAG: mucoidy inhibitor MuiA family protein [Chitinophagales bacterium]|nr:mucoidy inhibitor MuiA family protein [Chitinophagales bacterium]MDW8393229.1 mucoidy inhibitor MuiA family protein [Chitinophagales bacterium]